VREIAARIGLPNAKKKDSTGICFIGERPFREFLNGYLSFAPGNMVTPEGQVVGKHVGLSFYTLGQRKGLNIGGLRGYQAEDGTSEPWFVGAKDLERNRLIVVQGHEHPLLLSRGLTADQASWVSGEAPMPGKFAAKTRYRQNDSACVYSDAPDGFALAFDEPQWAATPGQSAVVYDGEICLGGGMIATVQKD